MNLAAKKQLGQHFLRDTGVIERIVRVFQPSSNDLVLEIGAGDGALSERLAPLVGFLVAVEIDAACIIPLQSKLAPFKHASILHADILKVDMNKALSLRPSELRLRMIGNLPYYLATQIIQHMLRLNLPVTDMLYMVQLEVAERITATRGSPAYSYISVFCQHFASTQMGFQIAPQCFVPRPNVVSAMIRLLPKPSDNDPQTQECFIDLVKAAFAYRRKKLINSLKRDSRFGPHADSILAEAGISGALRAEDLSIEDYERLSKLYYQIRMHDRA